MTLQANSISSLPRERLEKLFNDSVKKLKARDKELLSITAERDRLTAQQKENQGEEQRVNQGEAAAIESLRAELEVPCLRQCIRHSVLHKCMNCIMSSPALWLEAFHGFNNMAPASIAGGRNLDRFKIVCQRQASSRPEANEYLLLWLLPKFLDNVFLQGTKAELKDARQRINDLSEQQEALQDSKAAYKAEFENLQEENELLSRQVPQTTLEEAACTQVLSEAGRSFACYGDARCRQGNFECAVVWSIAFMAQKRKEDP